MNTGRIVIRTENVEDRKVVLATFLAMGYKWHGSNELNTAEKIEEKYSFRDYPHVVVRDEKCLAGTGLGESSVTFQEALRLIFSPPKQVSVQLNSSNVAVLTRGEETFKVGCQEFHTGVIANLAAALKSISE